MSLKLQLHKLKALTIIASGDVTNHH